LIVLLQYSSDDASRLKRRVDRANLFLKLLDCRIVKLVFIDKMQFALLFKMDQVSCMVASHHGNIGLKLAWWR